MSTDTRLISARPRKPRFARPWLALLLGLATAAFAGAGVVAVSAEPQETITIVVEDGLPLNITQQTVDAALGEPIKSWKPLTLRVTADLLSYDQLSGRTDAGADVVLSTAIEDDTDSKLKERFAGAAVRSPASDRDRATDDRFDIYHAYLRNVGLGHGPLAVVAAATTAADVLTSGPIDTPIFWVTGTGLGVLLTAVALSWSLRRRTTHESRYRRLVAAQRKLARVVLDLEALEVGYATTPEDSRPPAFTASWERLRDGSLALARREEEVIDAVFTRATALLPATGDLVSRFEAEARELTRLADALLGAGSVLGRLAGSGTTFDRVAAPLNDAAGELLIRLEAAPGGTLPGDQIERLRGALDALLSVAGTGSADARAGIQAFTKAERQLVSAAQAVAKALRRYPHGRVVPRERSTEDLSKLRAGLGLAEETRRGALAALDGANAVARAVLGPIEAFDDPSRVPTRPLHPQRATKKLPARKPDEPRRSHRAAWIIGGLAALICSLIAAGIITGTVLDRPSWELSGEEPLRSLVVDGRAEGIDEAGIRHYLDDRFPLPLDVTLAVRDGEEYLSWQPEDPGYTLRRLDPHGILDAMWRVKGEFPDQVDPITGELRPDKAIMLVMVFDDGRVIVPATLTGVMADGDANQLGSAGWVYGSMFAADDLFNVHLSMELEDLARGLQSNGFHEQDVNGTLLFWMLTFVLTLALLTCARAIQYGGSISAGLGRFGRGGAALRRAKRQLDTLALGLDDSRINAVAVLGAGPAGSGAEAAQRLFERALVMGWREAEDLAALPLAARLDVAYANRVAHLERLVTTLGERDADVGRRTSALLEATRGAGGGEPGTLKLP